MSTQVRDQFSMEEEFAAEVRLSHVILNAHSPATTINRTHRVVRERARTIQEQRRKVQSLWIPMVVCFGLLASILFAVWNLLDESEFFPNGIPDASQQMLVLSMWCLPLSAIVLVVVWFRRAGSKNGSQQ